MYFKLHTSHIADPNHKAQYMKPSSQHKPNTHKLPDRTSKDSTASSVVDEKLLSSLDDILTDVDLNVPPTCADRTSPSDSASSESSGVQKENIPPSNIPRGRKTSEGTFFKLQVSSIKTPTLPPTIDNTDVKKPTPPPTIDNTDVLDSSFSAQPDDLCGREEPKEKGTLFGFSGRTYRAKPMQNLLDIDQLNNSTSVEKTPRKLDNTLDFRDESICSNASEVSEDNVSSVTDLGYDTDLTLVTPIKNPDNPDFSKYFDDTLDDEVFVSARVSEIVSRFNNNKQNTPPSTNNSHKPWKREISTTGIPQRPYVRPEIVTEEAVHCVDVPDVNAPLDSSLLHMDEHSDDSDATIRDNSPEKQLDPPLPPSSSELLHNTNASNPTSLGDSTVDGTTTRDARRDVVDEDFINAYLKETSAEDQNVEEADLPESLSLATPGEEFLSEVEEDEMEEQEEAMMVAGISMVSEDECRATSGDEVNSAPPPLHSLKCGEAQELLTYLDTILINDDTFGRDFDVVKRLHALFWDLRDSSKAVGGDAEQRMEARETLTAVLNYMVVQEWPKVFVGVFKKLKLTFPHVFQEYEPEVCAFFITWK